jgi:hypothetical protein
MWNGIGIGIGRSSFAGSFAGSYSKRVLADGGTIEALSCVAGVSSILKRASLLLIPSGYKADVAYSALPRNGNGDLSWTRSSSATRLNSSGEIESMVSGVPRLDYSYGSCPAILLEPQRTNYVTNSVLAGAAVGIPGTLPTGCNYGITSGLSAQVLDIGTENGLSFIDIRFYGTATATVFTIDIPGTLPLVSGQIVTNSIYAKNVNNAPNISVRVIELNSSGSYVTEGGNSVSLTSTLSKYSYTKTVSGATTTQVRMSVYAFFTSGQTYDFTIRFAAPQMEKGAYSTSYIPTTTASVTRIEDLFVRNNIYTNGLITSSGGTWFIELKNNIQYTADSNTSGTFISNVPAGAGSGSNSINLRNPLSSNRLLINKIVNNSVDTIYQTNADNVKLAIKWNGSIIEVFANGSKVVSNSSFTPTNMEYLSSDARDQPRYIQKMALYKTPLSDSDCIALTT